MAGVHSASFADFQPIRSVANAIESYGDEALRQFVLVDTSLQV